MSQMYTCQLMSSPLSPDERPQLFLCTEPQSVAPVRSPFFVLIQVRHRTGAFIAPPVVKSTEVKQAGEQISGRAGLHIERASEKKPKKHIDQHL